MILKISLQPLNDFFFGGESSFNEGETRTRRSNYVLHSNKFPQQTGALGLIRNQLLIQSGLLTDNASRVKDKQRAKVLIGKTGFRLNAQNNFGVIKRISPVFLEANDKEICVPAPLDDVLIPAQKKGEAPKKMTFELEDTKGILQNYEEKEGVYAQFQHPQNGNAKLDDLFISNKRVGITKAARPWGEVNPDNDSGYYYQTFLGFVSEKETSQEKLDFYVDKFCFYIELNEQISKDDVDYEWADQPVKNFTDNKFTLHDAVVEFGGERSTFNMFVEKIPDWKMPTVSYKNTLISDKHKHNVSRLMCLSPAFIQDMKKLRSLTYLSVTQAIPFRFLQSAVGMTDHYQKVHRVDDQPQGNTTATALVESKLFHLLDRGSVLYFDSANKAQIEALFQHGDFQIIGYNQYHIL